jgi:hypothetical protein
MVVSTAEKAHVMRQVGAEKANVSEPLWKRRKRIDEVETGVQLLPRDESGGCLHSWPVGLRRRGGASSVQAPVRNVGTPRRDSAGPGVDPVGEREDPKQLICQGQSTDARQGGGPPRSSDEAPVMGAERRGRVVLILFAGQPEFPGGAG